MLGPAGQLVQIISGDVHKSDDMIYSLHCTKTNECEVTITTIANSTIVFPIGSFVRGAVYHIYLKTAKFDEDKAGFIGYKALKT